MPLHEICHELCDDYDKCTLQVRKNYLYKTYRQCALHNFPKDIIDCIWDLLEHSEKVYCYYVDDDSIFIMPVNDV